MSCIIKIPSNDELIKGAEKYIKYLEKELSNAKGYWYKFQIKIALKKEKEWLKELNKMSDLTEQWKKGELPNGWYWCKCYDEETKILYCDGDSFELDDPETKNYYFFLPKDIEEITVLEQMPTFEEWQASENYIDYLKQCISVYESKDKQATETSIAYNELLEENTKLKELLKEWAQFETEENPNDFTVISERMSELAKKTKQALGEDK